MLRKRGENKMARTGRPKADNPINVQTTVRLDKNTDEQLRQYCEKNKISKGEAVRKGIDILLRKQ